MGNMSGRMPTKSGQREIVDAVKNTSNPLEGFSACFVDKASPLTYVSMENKNSVWAVMKIDKTDGLTITYATQINNQSYNDVTTARENRESLDYQLPYQVF